MYTMCYELDILFAYSQQVLILPLGEQRYFHKGRGSVIVDYCILCAQCKKIMSSVFGSVCLVNIKTEIKCLIMKLSTCFNAKKSCGIREDPRT